MKKALLIIAGLFVVLVIVSIAAGGGEETDSGDKASSKTSPTETDEVTITSCTADPAVDWVVVKGKATNGSSKRSTYSIDLAIEGPDGTQLGTTFAIVENVEPDQTALWESPTTITPVQGFTCRVVDVERDASL